jgi:hypothetical protein
MRRERITPFRPPYADDPYLMSVHEKIMVGIRIASSFTLSNPDAELIIRWGPHPTEGEFLEITQGTNRVAVVDLTTYT